MRKLISLISAHGKSKKQLVEEVWQAFLKYEKANDPEHYKTLMKKEMERTKEKKCKYGKYKGERYKGVICDICGTQV